MKYFIIYLLELKIDAEKINLNQALFKSSIKHDKNGRRSNCR